MAGSSFVVEKVWFVKSDDVMTWRCIWLVGGGYL